jgi:hypothetical protein
MPPEPNRFPPVVDDSTLEGAARAAGECLNQAAILYGLCKSLLEWDPEVAEAGYSDKEYKGALDIGCALARLAYALGRAEDVVKLAAPTLSAVRGSPKTGWRGKPYSSAHREALRLAEDVLSGVRRALRLAPEEIRFLDPRRLFPNPLTLGVATPEPVTGDWDFWLSARILDREEYLCEWVQDMPDPSEVQADILEVIFWESARARAGKLPTEKEDAPGGGGAVGPAKAPATEEELPTPDAEAKGAPKEAAPVERPDGPFDGDKFAWKGNVCEDLSAFQYRLLDHFWNDGKPRTSMSFEEYLDLEEEVQGYRTKASNSSIRSYISRFCRKLFEARVHINLWTKNSYVHADFDASGPPLRP